MIFQLPRGVVHFEYQTKSQQATRIQTKTIEQDPVHCLSWELFDDHTLVGWGTCTYLESESEPFEQPTVQNNSFVYQGNPTEYPLAMEIVGNQYPGTLVEMTSDFVQHSSKGTALTVKVNAKEGGLLVFLSLEIVDNLGQLVAAGSVTRLKQSKL